jgi:hypothetical protein
MTCKHKNIKRTNDVGFDIDESSEEHQHLEECKDCGARRIVYFTIPFDGKKKPYNHYGEWETEGFLFSNMFGY